ncbi:transketolase [Streptomyces solincola]|uniref:Transketolase n=1 Tax=Streptomyces solincola TaxID=2100817 RepID=A0A2S9PUN0_9ACTN|nr:transketolase [Streptomyces solincola]PRH78118.1 transketolase [Streptomyces solincola]
MTTLVQDPAATGADAGADQLTELAAVALRVREHIVDICSGGEGGHLGGSLSLTEVLTALYFSVLNIDPEHPDDPDRDVFLLSKGHAAVGLYATLAERGFFPVEELAGFGQEGGRLMGHPIRAVPGVELPTGSLGHGLALGAGFALSAKLSGKPRHTFVALGDGELQEGSVWEAASSAAGLGLDNLTAVVDRNRLQLTGPTEDIAPLEPLADRWRAFGWAVRRVPGNDLSAVLPELASTPWEPGRPSVLIADTVKGAGVPFVADQVKAHYVRFTERQQARARAAVRRAAREQDGGKEQQS